MALTPGRRAAAAVLAEVGRGRRLDLAFADAVRGLDDRERRFVQELAYGTVRLRARLDHLLDRAVTRGLESLHPAVLDALRLGAYQLFHMDAVPPYAAVSQSVSLVRRAGQPRAAGLANAVLRAVARAGEDIAAFPSLGDDPAGHLSAWGSHPRWLVERWLARWPVDEVAALVEADNEVPPLSLVPLGDAEGAVEALGAAGGRARPAGRGSPALLVEGLDPREALSRVPGTIQDPAAALVARYAAPPRGSTVADLCAAPGGKALYLARSASYVLAADRSRTRLGLLRDNVRRTGLPVGIVQARAEAPPLRAADLVLLDVPCTGTGTLRRHPDARWRLEAGDPARMAELQLGMLGAAAGVVPSGGLLVYSTCTLEPEENEQVVERFLEERSDFRIDPPDEDLPDVDERGRLVILPWRTGFDGAFAARLRRRAT